jgi:hypothetical protein
VARVEQARSFASTLHTTFRAYCSDGMTVSQMCQELNAGYQVNPHTRSRPTALSLQRGHWSQSTTDDPSTRRSNILSLRYGGRPDWGGVVETP